MSAQPSQPSGLSCRHWELRCHKSGLHRHLYDLETKKAADCNAEQGPTVATCSPPSNRINVGSRAFPQGGTQCCTSDLCYMEL